ncbi:hypothetical protein RHSIM_Rhsim07G0249400 [Rhododendron simsii]|uniref:DNA/RNA-binding protein Alba-like domain-containing protein n=1 Tax=Rhododendron simsii TaxID=118357 RepID=A0A834GRF1_RHOSS|nr:hypothetical protein RHSIM_Rhsim07G0249400 [Rhododendron simsii]
MDRYQRVEKPRAETPIDENEIRITSQGRMRSYITYAMTLLQDPLLFRGQITKEKGSTEIVFKAMGRAINKTVTIVELIKIAFAMINHMLSMLNVMQRRIVGLHQITSIASIDITDTWEPLEEGLLPLETTRHVSMITITLSKKELNTSSVGYKKDHDLSDFWKISCPLKSLCTSLQYQLTRSRHLLNLIMKEVMLLYHLCPGSGPLVFDRMGTYSGIFCHTEGSPTGRGRGRGGRGRGRSRATYGNGYPAAEYDDGGWEGNRGYARGRGRGRGRNFRGRGRGFNGHPVDTQYDAGGYNQESPFQGRGRGRGRGYRGRGRGFRSNGPIHAAAEGA